MSAHNFLVDRCPHAHSGPNRGRRHEGRHMDRRTFTKTLAADALSGLVLPASEVFGAPAWVAPRTPERLRRAESALPQAKITGIRLYQGPNVMPLQIPLLQSSMVVAIDTDIGITGIGEGGTLDTITPNAG